MQTVFFPKFAVLKIFGIVFVCCRHKDEIVSKKQSRYLRLLRFARNDDVKFIE
jgi:hypothetical protein